MKNAIQFLAFLIVPFVLFGQYTDATTAIKVKSGITCPSTITREESFIISFSLKETLGQALSVQQITVAFNDNSNGFMFDLKSWISSSYTSFTANETKDFSFSAVIHNTPVPVPEGAYKLLVKLKISGAWYNINTLSGATNPKSVNIKAPTPVIVTSTANLNFGSVEVGSSKTLSYTVSAQNLTADLKLTAPAGYNLRAESSAWGPTLTIPPSSDGSINNVTIQVRFSPTQPGPYNGLISHKSTGANTKNVNLSADAIEIPSYNIQTSVSPSQGGSVSGGGIYIQNSVCNLVAYPNPAYNFTGWYDLGGNLQSQSANYSFNVTGDRYLIAKFTLQPPPSYSVTVVASPIEGGSVTGGGSFVQGSTCSVTATSATGYDFSGWFDATTGNLESSYPSYTFTVYGNKYLSAQFSPQPPITYTVLVVSSPLEGGSISGGGSFVQGSTCYLNANPNPGWTFSQFEDLNGTVLSYQNPFSFPVTNENYIVARFSSTTAIQKDHIPVEFKLAQNYPNPFNPSTTIRVDLPVDMKNVKLSVFNSVGEEVSELVNGSMSAGVHMIEFNAKNLPSGIYFYRIEAGENIHLRKMILMK